MNHLMPPPQRDLPETDHREIRAALVRTSRATRRPRRRGLVLVSALAATGVVAAVGLDLPGDLGLTRTGVPGPAGPVPTATAQGTAGSSMFPAAQPIDRGPLDSSTAKRIVADCLYGYPGDAAAARVHLARETTINGAVVLVTDSTGVEHMCTKGSDVADRMPLVAGAGDDVPRPRPDQRQPVVQLMGKELSGRLPAASGVESYTTATQYRVGADVASLQLRLTVDGHTGPWFEASMANGYAWAAASVEFHSATTRDDHPDHHVDDRAFDAAGHELDIDHTRR